MLQVDSVQKAKVCAECDVNAPQKVREARTEPHDPGFKSQQGASSPGPHIRYDAYMAEWILSGEY